MVRFTPTEIHYTCPDCLQTENITRLVERLRRSGSLGVNTVPSVQQPAYKILCQGTEVYRRQGKCVEHTLILAGKSS